MSFLRNLLTPFTFLLSLVYGSIIWIRNKLYDLDWIASFSFDIPIISVGNTTTGGSGKTPLVIYLSQMLQRRGKKPGIVSRGYGRKSQGMVIVHDGKELIANVENSGDEPYLMASVLKTVPMVVCEDRREGINHLLKNNSADVIIMDDGFQHRKVKRDLDIITISANDKKEDYRLLPWGKLREPLQNIGRANAAIFTRTNNYNPPELLPSIEPFIKGEPLFSTQQLTLMKYDEDGYRKSLPPEEILFAFCGIGEPRSFFDSIVKLGLKSSGKRIFRDHQEYTSSVINELSTQIKSSNCKGIITTEKDLVKLPNNFLDEFEIYVIKIEMEFEIEEVVLDIVRAILRN